MFLQNKHLQSALLQCGDNPSLFRLEELNLLLDKLTVQETPEDIFLHRHKNKVLHTKTRFNLVLKEGYYFYTYFNFYWFFCCKEI